MYIEQLNGVLTDLNSIEERLRSIAGNALNDIFAQDKSAKSINVAYYTDRDEDWTFYGTDGDGEGHALFINDIRIIGNEYIFNMRDEYGEDYEERDLSDFNTTDLIYVVRLLANILDVVRRDERVHTEYDWS